MSAHRGMIALLAQSVSAGGGGGGGSGFYRTITIDHTKAGASDTTNYRLLVSLAGQTFLKTISNGGKIADASGFDIGFYADSALATKLDWEIEHWDGAAGDLIAWVRVPTLSHTSDTVIYLAYGISSITTDQSNKTGVWGANAKSVLHFGDGSSLSVADSSTTNETWSTSGPPTAGTGKIYGGMVVSGTQDLQSAAPLNVPTGPLTARLWFKPSSLAGTNAITSSNHTDTTHPGFLIQANGTQLRFYADGDYRETSQTLSTGTWYLLGLTVSISGSIYTWKFYKNGSLLSTYTGSNTFYGVGDVFIAFGFAGSAQGTYDEARYIDETASPDQMLAEYNNENDPSTFYSVGAETAA